MLELTRDPEAACGPNWVVSVLAGSTHIAPAEVSRSAVSSFVACPNVPGLC